MMVEEKLSKLSSDIEALRQLIKRSDDRHNRTTERLDSLANRMGLGTVSEDVQKSMDALTENVREWAESLRALQAEVDGHDNSIAILHKGLHELRESPTARSVGATENELRAMADVMFERHDVCTVRMVERMGDYSLEVEVTRDRRDPVDRTPPVQLDPGEGSHSKVPQEGTDAESDSSHSQ